MRDKNGKELKYYNFQDIFEFLGLGYHFEKTHGKEYPFHRGKEKIKFSWGQILIPKDGIEEIVLKKIQDDSEKPLPLKEIKMMVQFAFVDTSDNEGKCGIINQDVTVGFNYGKEYKYGNINKSIYEVCYAISKHSKLSNNFYVMDETYMNEFMSYYVINNQWGFGATTITSPPCEYYGQSLSPDDEVYS